MVAARSALALLACTGLLLTGCSGSGGNGDGTASGTGEHRPAPGDRDGRSEGIGDFDKDGYDDFVTAVTTRASGESRAWHVVVVPGSKRGLDAARATRYSDVYSGPLLRGDLDGDGYPDLVATREPEGPDGMTEPGATYQAVVMFGGKNGLGKPVTVAAERQFLAMAVADVNGDGAVDLIDRGKGAQDKDPARIPGRIAYGPFDRDGVPARLVGQDWEAAGGGATAGDFDGDGFDDLLFTGSPPYSDDEPEPMVPPDAYFRGSPDGPVPAAVPQGLDNDVEDGDLTPQAGDVDGDGITDLLVGGGGVSAPADGLDTGQLTIVYGAKGGPGTGRRSTLYNQETPGIPGDSQGNDKFGAVSGTGDVNGDGHPDLVINTPGEDKAGRFTLLPGAADGSGPDPSRSTAFDATTYGRPWMKTNLPPLDINGDRHADVVAETSDGLFLFLGGEAGFTAGDPELTEAAKVGLDEQD
ncbi:MULTISPECIES: FG-GAP and VCBS repeat-containing protein [unclassified Streptomyces]|uniref:FG-GAP and VCBS repeat-containing protein n=1 Tax=unclassified Streptomyces TaxID=2593676 RepID=UPI0033AD06D6